MAFWFKNYIAYSYSDKFWLDKKLLGLNLTYSRIAAQIAEGTYIQLPVSCKRLHIKVE